MKQDGTKANAEYFGTFGDIHVGYLDMGGTNVEVIFMEHDVIGEAYLN